MKKLGKLFIAVVAMVFIAKMAVAQQITRQKGLSDLNPEFKQKLEDHLNRGGFYIKSDTVKTLAPETKPLFQQYNHGSIPGIENMPSYNPAPLSQWKMPYYAIDSTTNYQIQKKFIPRNKENSRNFQFKGKEPSQNINPELKN